MLTTFHFPATYRSAREGHGLCLCVGGGQSRELALRSHRDPVRLNSGLPRRADLARVGVVPLLRPEIAGHRASQRILLLSARRTDGVSLTRLPWERSPQHKSRPCVGFAQKAPTTPHHRQSVSYARSDRVPPPTWPGCGPAPMHLRGDVPGSPFSRPRRSPSLRDLPGGGLPKRLRSAGPRAALRPPPSRPPRQG